MDASQKHGMDEKLGLRWMNRKKSCIGQEINIRALTRASGCGWWMDNMLIDAE